MTTTITVAAGSPDGYDAVMSTLVTDLIDAPPTAEAAAWDPSARDQAKSAAVGAGEGSDAGGPTAATKPSDGDRWRPSSGVGQTAAALSGTYVPPPARAWRSPSASSAHERERARAALSPPPTRAPHPHHPHQHASIAGRAPMTVTAASRFPATASNWARVWPTSGPTRVMVPGPYRKGL